MIGIVIVAHGGLATEYKAAVEHVVGAQRGIAAVAISADCDREAKRIEICQAADGVDIGGGVVIVTDMFGGSPSNLSLSACNCANRRVLYGANDDSIYLSPAPLYHAAPLAFTMGCLRSGTTVVVMAHFEAEFALECIENYRITHSQWVPTMFVRMLKLPEEVRLKYDVSSLRCAIHAAAPCPIPIKEKMIDWWGPVIYEYYAGTEGNGFVQLNSEEWLAHKGSVGKPLTCEIHICDEHGEEVPAGESGTIYMSGGGTFEYYKDDDKTADSRHAQGWSTLGDVGYLDDDGFLYLTDRKHFMIISGGVNIYPQEAENVLINHDKVMDVAVFGVPNADFGEEVKGVVQLADPSLASPLLEVELLDYCREYLSHIKCPRSIDFRDELPRHPTGKLYKRLLKDEYWAKAGA